MSRGSTVGVVLRHDRACDRHDCGGQGVISVTSNVVPSLMSSLMLRKQPQLDDRCICFKDVSKICCTTVTGYCLATAEFPEFSASFSVCLVVDVWRACLVGLQARAGRAGR